MVPNDGWPRAQQAWIPVAVSIEPPGGAKLIRPKMAEPWVSAIRVAVSVFVTMPGENPGRLCWLTSLGKHRSSWGGGNRVG